MASSKKVTVLLEWTIILAATVVLLAPSAAAQSKYLSPTNSLSAYSLKHMLRTISGHKIYVSYKQNKLSDVLTESGIVHHILTSRGHGILFTD